MITYAGYDVPPRCDSPAFVPAPLPIPKRPRSASKRARTAPALRPPPEDDVRDPVLTLSRHVYVKPPAPPTAPLASLPSTIVLTPYTSASTPSVTHVLALHDADSNGTAVLVPINEPELHHSLRALITLPPSTSTTARGAPVRVNVVPFAVPHAETASLLLIFAMRVHPRGPRVLLPGLAGAAAESMTDIGAAARVLAGSVGLDARVAEHQGVWRNALALGVKDENVMEALRFVWEVAVEARRLAKRGATR
ncbi:hypothetical protein PENSPDRAFT_687869 [Peniophora sp. CONT]|nr:hypothetical protein PENSPDRAFT_687869 [Peniophora sp. CONT]